MRLEQKNPYQHIYALAIILLGMVTCYGQNDTIYSANGNILEIGTMEDGFKNGHWVSYFPDGNIRYEGLFDQGYRVGHWTWFHENGRICSIEKWRKGVYKRGDYWDSEGNQSDIMQVLTHPEYPGGIEAFTRLIVENITYPEQVLDEGVEGRVVLEFQISRSGRLVNPKVAERAHPVLEEEALRVVQLSGQWIPAKFHGENTSAVYTFPISFALQ